MRYFLELCLKSVQEAIANIDAEIIVVDNNSEDDSCEMVKELSPDVKLIENKENSGFSKGNNIGVEHAKGEYLCILNPDTVVPEDIFEKLLEFCKNKKSLGAVGCKLIDGTGHFLPESKRNVPFINTALKKLIGHSKTYYASHLNKDESGDVAVLVGAFMFLKKNVYQEVGGFDEDYFMYGEDIDLSFKIKKAGYHNYYFGKTSVVHYKGESTLKDKTYAKRFYGAMQIFYHKHFKKNLIFDALVWFGINIMPLLKKSDVKPTKTPVQYVLISDEEHKKLEVALSRKVWLKNEIADFEAGTEVIFDNQFINFKSIIAEMEEHAAHKKFTFKILPKSSNFILGSNSASGKGEVIEF